MNEVQEFYSKNIKYWLDNPRYTIREGYLDLLGDISGKRIIDIGCGCGFDMQILSKRHKNIKGIGLDFCKESIEEAKVVLGNYTDWKFVQKDMMDYNPQQRFDIIVFSMVVMFYPDLCAIFKKMASLLNPGGQLLLVTNNPYLICKEYDVPYPEGTKSIKYQHVFPIQGKGEAITKYVHSFSSYINSALTSGFIVQRALEQAVYNEETSFYNPDANPSIPNFISFLYKLS